MNNYHDQIWAYLSNELTPKQKSAFEEALKTDEVLRQAFNEREETEALLKEVAPNLEFSVHDEQLTDHLLTLWENEHPEYQEKMAYNRRNIIRVSIPAVAAAIALMLLVLPWKKGPVHWKRTVYGDSPQVRGDSENKPNFSKADLKNINRILKRAIETDLSALGTAPENWNLQIHLQELAHGNLMIEISGHPDKQPNRAKLWKTDFQGVENTMDEVPEFGRQVAEEISDQEAP